MFEDSGVVVGAHVSGIFDALKCRPTLGSRTCALMLLLVLNPKGPSTQ